MTNNNVISIQALRDLRNAQEEDHAYHAMILSMDKLALLEEMVRFQEERSRMGKLSLQMMVRGRHLFKALEANAETQELRILTGSYRRHLEYELTAYRQGHRYEGDAVAAREEG